MGGGILQTFLVGPKPAVAQSAMAVPAEGRSTSGADSLSTSPADSVSTSPLDSLSTPPADSSAAAAPSERSGPGASAPLVPPWQQRAALSPADLAQLRAGTLVRLLEAMPHASVRVAGDFGAPAYLSLSPIDIAAPELLLDGVPSRSPADLDPAVWDRSAAGVLAVDGWDGAVNPADEPRVVRLRSDPGSVGETVLRTHFHKQPNETYLRGLSLTTPYAATVLRADYEEWKTEEGSAFLTVPQPSGAASLGETTPFGESKMRRFRAGVDLQTSVGRASALFGRGRRFYRGTVASTLPTERWTGEMVLGLDAPLGANLWQVRAYHLDFSDHDFAHAETRDASRLGLRAQRAPSDDGVGWLATVERARARYEGRGSRVVLTEPTWESTARAGIRRTLAARWHATAAVEGRYADRTDPDLGWGGEAELGLRAGGGLLASLGASRSLRAPTLLETQGFQSYDLPAVDPFTIVREGAAGELPFERQELLRAAVQLGAGRATARVALERHWLSDGIGWLPEQLTAVDGMAATVGGLSLRVDQVAARLRLAAERERRGVVLLADGHRVLGDLRRSLDRGAGWPREALGLHLRAWHRLFGPRDRIAVAYDLRHLGPRFDDRLAVYGVQVPATTRHDLRLILKLRDAELSLGVENLTDALQQEVSGTTRRGMEVIWGLTWPFVN